MSVSSELFHLFYLFLFLFFIFLPAFYIIHPDVKSKYIYPEEIRGTRFRHFMGYKTDPDIKTMVLQWQRRLKISTLRTWIFKRVILSGHRIAGR